VFKIKSGGKVKDMIKIMNQLSKANRPVIFEYETVPSLDTFILYADT
jgi:membrane-bound ClpP family serine protease